MPVLIGRCGGTTPAVGGWELIDTWTLSGNQVVDYGTGASHSAVIPQTYRALRIWLHGRSTGVAATDSLVMTLNADNGAAYDTMGLQSHGGGPAVYAFSTAGTFFNCGGCTGDGAVAGDASLIDMQINGYADTAFNKIIQCYTVLPQSGGNPWWTQGYGSYHKTPAITRFTFTPGAAGATFKAGTRLDLYGIGVQ